MFFRLCNSSATFFYMMTIIFQEMIYTSTLTNYMDNFFIPAQSKAELQEQTMNHGRTCLDPLRSLKETFLACLTSDAAAFDKPEYLKLVTCACKTFEFFQNKANKDYVMPPIYTQLHQIVVQHGRVKAKANNDTAGDQDQSSTKSAAPPAKKHCHAKAVVSPETVESSDSEAEVQVIAPHAGKSTEHAVSPQMVLQVGAHTSTVGIPYVCVPNMDTLSKAYQLAVQLSTTPPKATMFSMMLGEDGMCF
ncbi:hypothetical protein AN958_12808 [Leucoagaricus sp. SymC.cos]|nr:hypothetical protein AN958_12808 [Leucoagaricus sp. SymC.cos]